MHEVDREVLRRRVGWGLVTLAIAGSVALGLSPSPYVVERPGPVYDTLGEAPTSDGDPAPLITIDGETTYPTEGELDLLTVSVLGDPQDRVDWFQIAQAWFDRSQAVVPLESIYPDGETAEESDAQSAQQMTSSQQEAIAAALTELGIDFGSTITVGQVIADSPAEKAGLTAGDRIVAVGGTRIHLSSDVRDAIVAHGTDSPVDVQVERAGATATYSLTPEEVDGRPLIGIAVAASYDFPFEVSIRLDAVGGPSAGQMFALGIYDKLTPGSLAGGAHVAGTGTIDAGGTVGPIGGIRQKLYGAERAGADWFLAPESNCTEVVGHVPDGIRVVAVATLQDSIDALEAIAADDADGLPTCTG